MQKEGSKKRAMIALELEKNERRRREIKGDLEVDRGDSYIIAKHQEHVTRYCRSIY
jgi:hypothetical protein